MTETKETDADGEIDFASLEIVEAEPNRFRGPSGSEEVFRALRGARIEKIGSADADIEGGGLLIDYVPPLGTGQARRVVFAFTELGMWVEWAGVPNQASSQG